MRARHEKTTAGDVVSTRAPSTFSSRPRARVVSVKMRTLHLGQGFLCSFIPLFQGSGNEWVRGPCSQGRARFLVGDPPGRGFPTGKRKCVVRTRGWPTIHYVHAIGGRLRFRPALRQKGQRERVQNFLGYPRFAKAVSTWVARFARAVFSGGLQYVRHLTLVGGSPCEGFSRCPAD